MVTTAPGIPTFDLTDASFSAKSPAVREAREQNWYARTNFGLVALRYEEVHNLLRDRRLRQGLYAWPQQNGVTEGIVVDWWAESIIATEGEMHRRVRRIANPIFGSKVIERLAPGFRRLAHELVDAFAPRGSCEFVQDFAEPYAARILLQMFGVPEDEWRELARWSAEFGMAFGVGITQDMPRIEAALRSLYAFADDLIAARRRTPGDDVVSSLVAASEGGERLTTRELRTLIVTLVFGGMDTTRNQLGLALHTFACHPEQWELLAARPDLGAAAVEEVMRVEPTVLWITRETVEDVVVGDVLVPRGTTVHLFTEPANTDPRAGADGTFDITAERPKQLGFGAGPHHCIGHFLARVDMREALPILAQRMRNLRVDGQATFRPASGMTGPIALPVRFHPEPGAR